MFGCGVKILFSELLREGCILSKFLYDHVGLLRSGTLRRCNPTLGPLSLFRPRDVSTGIPKRGLEDWRISSDVIRIRGVGEKQGEGLG